MADKTEVLQGLEPQAQACLRKQKQRIDRIQAQYDALEDKTTSYAEQVKTLLDMNTHGVVAMSAFYNNVAYNLQR
jgi:hypothetical protein